MRILWNEIIHVLGSAVGSPKVRFTGQVLRAGVWGTEEVYTEHLSGTRSLLGVLGERDFDKVVESS